MTTVDGNQIVSFSQQALDLQKDFCCNNLSKTSILRWIGCKPGIYQGAKTIFTSEDLGFCSWFMSVNSYSFGSSYLEPGDIAEINLNSRYLLVKVKFTEPDGLDMLESLKLFELGIGEQQGYVGMTIPFLIDYPTTPYTYRYFVVKDLFNISTESLLKTPLKLNNISPYNITVNMLYAN